MHAVKTALRESFYCIHVGSCDYNYYEDVKIENSPGGK